MHRFATASVRLALWLAAARALWGQSAQPKSADHQPETVEAGDVKFCEAKEQATYAFDPVPSSIAAEGAASKHPMWLGS